MHNIMPTLLLAAEDKTKVNCGVLNNLPGGINLCNTNDLNVVIGNIKG